MYNLNTNNYLIANKFLFYKQLICIIILILVLQKKIMGNTCGLIYLLLLEYNALNNQYIEITLSPAPVKVYKKYWEIVSQEVLMCCII